MVTIDKKEKKIIEAFLFAADEPLDLATLQSKVKKNTDVLAILDDLQKDYSEKGINLIKLANRWSFRTSLDLADQLKEEITGQKNYQKLLSKPLRLLLIINRLQDLKLRKLEACLFLPVLWKFCLSWVGLNQLEEKIFQESLLRMELQTLF